MKGHKTKDGKFHPHTKYNKSPRKKREPFKVEKTEGVPMSKLVQMQRADVGRRKHDDKEEDLKLIQKEIKKHERELHGMSNSKADEWEEVVGSNVVKVKHEMIDGMPVTTVRFENGEEWFEFDSVDHQEQFMRKNNLHKIEYEEGKLVEVDHPTISAFIVMPSGKVLFGEKEDTRYKKSKLKTIYPYKKDAMKLSKLKFKDLPDELQDDLSDLSESSGRMTFHNPEEEWDEMTSKQKEQFLMGISEYDY